jgi:hypothetical protein
MDGNIIEFMLKFTPDALATEFMEQYKFEYGEKKVIEIIRKVENSDKVQQYLANILYNDIKPSPKGLETVMNTMSYFMFSREETLCLGGLACFIMWRNRWMIKNNIFDAREQNFIDKTLVHICVEYVDDRSKCKYNINNNFFFRFQRRIGNIAREEGL